MTTKRRTRKRRKTKGKKPKIQRLRDGREYKVDDALYDVIRTKKASKRQIVNRLWKYIREHRLRHKVYKKQIRVDHKLKKICGKEFGIGEYVRGYHLNRYIRNHVS